MPIPVGAVSPQLRRGTNFLPPKAAFLFQYSTCFFSQQIFKGVSVGEAVRHGLHPVSFKVRLSLHRGAMVLERLWRSKSKDPPLELDDPFAYGSNAYDDCLSCRVVGT